MTDEPTSDGEESTESKTLTLELSFELDDVHGQMWEEVCAATADEDDLREGLENQLASDLAESGHVDEMLHHAYQQIKQRKRQIAQQHAQQQQQTAESD